MKKNYTHLTVCLDRSGSMASMAKDVIGGFNTLVADQIKVEGEATMTVAKFDTQYEIISDFMRVSDVILLDSSNFQPRGSTALLDAMGKTMNDVRERINQMPEDEKPSKALFVFMTDGEENASREYNRDRVFEMISDLKNESENDESAIQWDFVFIGANQDAIQAGGSYGIRRDASLTYTANGDGATRAFCSLSDSITSYRGASKGVTLSFSDEDRKEQEEIANKTSKRFDNCIPYSMSDLVDTSDKTKKS